MLPGLRKILSNLNGVTIATMPKKRKGTLSRAVKEVPVTARLPRQTVLLI